MTRMHYRAAVAAILIAAVVTIPSPLAAQQTAREAFNYDVHAGFEDGWRILSAPTRFDGRDWLMTALAFGATAAAFTIDDDVRNEVRAREVDEASIPLVVGEKWGSGLVSGGLGLGLLVTGALTQDDDTRITGRMVLQSLVYSAAITQLLKVLVGRERPFTEGGKAAFDPFRIDNAHHSFPSGHATVAFALSSTLSRRAGSVPLSIALYALSTLTVAERIASDSHWLSDTVLGAVLGSVVGIAVVRFEEEREREGESSGIQVDGFLPQLTDAEFESPFIRHRPLLQWSVTF